MKAILLSISILFSGFLMASGSEAYRQHMQETIALYDSVKTMDDYREIVNRFERLAQMEQDEWLPSYYAGLTYVYMSFVKGLEDDQRDDYLDQAERWAQQAEQIGGENVETVILHGYIEMAKLTVSPALRGMTLSGKISALFSKALAMDPQNPRANLMQGRWKYGSAQFFGSGTEEACAYFNKAQALYAQQAKDQGIAPAWGEGMTQRMLKSCK